MASIFSGGRTPLILACSAMLLAGCESLSLARGAANYERTLDTYSQTDTTETGVTNRRHADGPGRRTDFGLFRP